MRTLLSLLALFVLVASVSAQNIQPSVNTNDDLVQLATDVTLAWVAPDEMFEFQKPKTFMWDFGDNTRGTGNPVTHRYKKTGSFKVLLVTDDGKGNQKNYRITVKIKTLVEFPAE